LATEEKTLELVKMIEETGVSAITVHCRTKEERPKDRAHWDQLSKIRDVVTTIPVIANGDVFQPEDMDKLRREYGITSFMMARGALWNPSIFSPSGMVDQKQVALAYIQKALDVDNLFQNTKYTLMQMYESTKSTEYQHLQKSKNHADICAAFGLEQNKRRLSSPDTANKKIRTIV
jgi:tRNA-dihydrouridine synthase 2